MDDPAALIPLPDLVSCSQAARLLGVSIMDLRDLVGGGLIARAEEYTHQIKIPAVELYRYARWNRIHVQPPGPFPILLVGFRAAMVSAIDDFLADHDERIQVFEHPMGRCQLCETVYDVAPLGVFAVNIDGLMLGKACAAAPPTLKTMIARPHWTAEDIGKIGVNWFKDYGVRTHGNQKKDIPFKPHRG